jgi:hypothetical protein
MRDEQADQMKALQEELQAKSQQVKELHKAQADIRRLKREKAEVESKAEAEMERKLRIERIRHMLPTLSQYRERSEAA